MKSLTRPVHERQIEKRKSCNHIRCNQLRSMFHPTEESFRLRIVFKDGLPSLLVMILKLNTEKLRILGKRCKNAQKDEAINDNFIFEDNIELIPQDSIKNIPVTVDDARRTVLVKSYR